MDLQLATDNSYLVCACVYWSWLDKEKKIACIIKLQVSLFGLLCYRYTKLHRHQTHTLESIQWTPNCDREMRRTHQITKHKQPSDW